MKRKHALLLRALATALPAAQAQTGKWPEKPVRVIVPMVAGSTSDVLARTFTSRLSEEYGQPFVVDNRGGAGGAIGAEIAARARPDGYTVVYVPSSYAATPAFYTLPYDPVKGVAPISLILIVPFILVVQPSVKAGNLKEFIARNGNMSTMLLLVILVGMGEKMAERFLPLYLLALGGSTWAVGLLNSMDNMLSALYSFPGGYLAEVCFSVCRSLLRGSYS